jgi:hypothetical protein
MKTLQDIRKEATRRKRLRPVEWVVDAPRAVQVRAGNGRADRPVPERIRHVELAIGILDHRIPGSITRLYRYGWIGRVDG